MVMLSLLQLACVYANLADSFFSSSSWRPLSFDISMRLFPLSSSEDSLSLLSSVWYFYSY